jgi:hypothetical protein
MGNMGGNPGNHDTMWLFNIGKPSISMENHHAINGTSPFFFDIAMERSTMLLIGKPSISMGHLYHGYVE